MKPQVKGTSPETIGNHGSSIRNGVLYCYGGKVRVNDQLEMFMLNFGRDVVAWSNTRLYTKSLQADPLR